MRRRREARGCGLFSGREHAGFLEHGFWVCLGMAIDDPSGRHGPVADLFPASPAVQSSDPRIHPHRPQDPRQEGPGRHLQLRGPDGGPFRHRGHRQYRRGGHGHLYRRPRRAVLDVDDRPCGHGHQVRRGRAGREIPRAERERHLQRRPHVLHLARAGLEMAGHALRLFRGYRHLRHRQYGAVQFRG